MINNSIPYEYEVGDRVWITSPEPQQGLTRKFKSKYVGPFVLVAKIHRAHIKFKGKALTY